MAKKNRLHPIPKPDSTPVLGNMLSVDGVKPLQGLMEMSKELGPIYWLDMMGKPIVLVSGPELVKELCDETRFDKTVRGPLKRVRAIGGDGLFTGDTTAPNWSKAHNILMPTFSQKAMVDYLPMMVDIAEQLMLKWERLNADEEIDVVRDMTGLTLDTIGLCGFDYRFNSFYREDFHPFIGALNRTLETCMKQKGLPFEKMLLRKRLKQMGEDVGFMNKLVDDIIRERRQGGGDQHDLLNYMLAGVDKVTGESLSDENIRYQINTFLIAGHETTSGLMSFTLYYLLKNPGVLAKAYAEVDKVLGSDIGQAPTISQIGKLDYIRAILLEGLRLWPTAPAFSVTPFKDEIIGGKYKIKKGTFTTILIPSLHRDTSIWGDDPDAFNPDHFSREAEADRPAYAYKPFGNGQRACIGRQFALQEAILVLGMLLQRFQMFDHQNYQLDVKETLSIKPEGFLIKAKVRKGLTRSAASSIKKADEPEIAQKAKHGAKLCVLYGSNLGTAESYARELAHIGDLNGFTTELATLDAYADKLPTEGTVIIVSASYNGQPPDNAVKFIEFLEKSRPGDVKDVNYAVFGCGSRDWAATFQTIPRLIDESLEELGATQIMKCGEGDASGDLDGDFHAWSDALWPVLNKSLSLDIDMLDVATAEPLYKVEIAESVMANPVANLAHAVPMTILENRELQNHSGKHASERSTRHIEIALPEGMDYQPGDHLCVVPVNSQEIVDRAMARFGYDKNTYVRVNVSGGRRSPFPNGSTFSVKRLAEVYGEPQAVASRKDMAVLARYTQCPKTKPIFEALAAAPKDSEDRYWNEVYLKRRSVLDLLEEHPACELPFAVFMEMIPWIAPRYYSISSAPSQKPGQCAITVAIVEGPARSENGIYRGVCSNFLSNAEVGDTIQAVIKPPTSDFRLPSDVSRPIIMIGPGTGVAPFRAFLQDRHLQKEKTLGDAMLFFGCRHPKQDFIYEDELKQAVDDGLVELHSAFSRLSKERVYVQDLVRKQGEKVWKLIERGAVIYVCGDGASMEPDVKQTLTALYAEEKDVSLEIAVNWMVQMAKDGRYVLDVWAGN